MSCPQQSIPAGWRVWRGAVPTPITQAAMDIRDHVRSYQLGAIAKTMDYNGEQVAFFVSNHPWTYRNGVLVTGICIWGVSVLTPIPAGAQQLGTPPDDLANPDATAAVYGADDVPERGTNWPLVFATSAAIVATTAAFVLALKLAGRPRLP